MVQLELEKDKSSKVQIRVKEKKRAVGSRFLRALGYSVLLHGFVFGLFRVKTNLVEEEPSPLAAIEVGIVSEKMEDAENTQDGQVIAIASDDSSEKKLFFSEQEPLVPQPVSIPDDASFTETSFMHELCMHSINLSPMMLDTPPQLPKLAEIPNILWKERIYPLSIKMSDSLCSLILIEDGSTLFKEKSRSIPNPITTSTNTVTIEYKIKVAGKSGKVTSCTRKRELLDKQLQIYADTIAHNLQFAPAKEKTYHGRLWLQFSCSAEDLEKMFREPPRGSR